MTVGSGCPHLTEPAVVRLRSFQVKLSPRWRNPGKTFDWTIGAAALARLGEALRAEVGVVQGYSPLAEPTGSPYQLGRR